MKTLTTCLLLILMIGCKKQTTAPAAKQTPIVQSQPFPDTSLSGTYRMYASTQALENDTNMTFTCRFVSYQYDSTIDSNNPFIVYRLHDKRFSVSTLGNFWVSKNAEYQSSIIPKADPFVTFYKGTVAHGFIQCAQVTYSNGGTFNNDTLILPLYISPVNVSVGPPAFLETVSYKRIGN